MPSQLLKSVSIAGLMLLGMAQARGLMDSYKSAYFSSYCQKYRCVLERKIFSHTDGIDYLVYHYRLRDGSHLLVSRYEPFDRREKPDGYDYRVAVLTLELGKKLTPLQLERRLGELLGMGTGGPFERMRFDVFQKCDRPGQERKDPVYGYIFKSHTFVYDGRGYEITCQRSAASWQLHLHRGIILPTGGGVQVWP